MKKDDVMLCPIFSIGHRLKPITSEVPGGVLFHELVTMNNRWFLTYRIDEQDLGRGFAPIFLKFRFFSTGLSMATTGHFWVDDVLLNRELQPIWERKKSIKLVVDREISQSGPSPLTAQEFVRAGDVEFWIAKNYSRVFNYHHIGLFLLRSNLATEYLYADILLNFFKVVELVTFARARKKPDLDAILKEHRNLRNKKLNPTDIEESEIEEFYILRCRDAAHDWDEVRGITRKKALDCKLWSEALVLMDMEDRAPHYKEIIEVLESDKGAIARPKATNDDQSEL
jgi:hypothetical protein